MCIDYWDDIFSVDGHCVCGLFCLNLSEQKEYWQTSIQQTLERYHTSLHFKDQIFIFLTQNIEFSMLKLMILDPKIMIEDTEHALIVP